MKTSAIEVITITGQESVWYFNEDAFNLNMTMDDARELTDDERVKFDVQN